MAEYLASIFGTEKDKVNCSFYFKIGACRHGDRCSRLHNKPTFSQTIVLLNLYRNPQNTAQASELHNIICSTQEPPPPVPPPIKVKKFVNQGLWFPSTPTPKKGCKPTTVSAEELGASLGSGSALVSRGCFNTCNLRLSILGAF
uniref:Isoform 4 of Splicing factor U2AF 26 kDa subunit n=1 Tax=Mus musculus TaxID=10090 RepID=Q8BGJ9-4